MADLAQMQLFSTKIVPVGKKRGTLAERFREFHALNPHVYLALVVVAKEFRNRTGRKQIGMKALYERIRWEFALRTTSDCDYALDNSYTAYYARLIMLQEPELANAFETRKLRSAA